MDGRAMWKTQVRAPSLPTELITVGGPSPQSAVNFEPYFNDAKYLTSASFSQGGILNVGSQVPFFTA